MISCKPRSEITEYKFFTTAVCDTDSKEHGVIVLSKIKRKNIITFEPLTAYLLQFTENILRYFTGVCSCMFQSNASVFMWTVPLGMRGGRL